MSRLGKGEDEATAHSVAHAKEKFGRYGYARYPNLYRVMYAGAIDELYDEIDAL